MLELIFFDDQRPASINEKPIAGIIDNRGAAEERPVIEVHFFDDRAPLVLYSTALVDVPPAEFAHPAPNVVLEILPAAKIAEQCGNGGKAEACVLMKPNFKGDKCFMLLPSVGPGGVSQKTQDLLRRHENGHCNGWEHKP
jgi:hypothetical protein